ncbi:MAG: hypothetical protein Q7K55_03510 [Candidatus Levybacteria bacterium]|nr:hypothetical protein [Candidatus Levybacteria bacterium]
MNPNDIEEKSNHEIAAQAQPTMIMAILPQNPIYLAEVRLRRTKAGQTPLPLPFSESL